MIEPITLILLTAVVIMTGHPIKPPASTIRQSSPGRLGQGLKSVASGARIAPR